MNLPTPIVLTNDDGIEAEGLRALEAALAPHVEGQLYTVAPGRCYSGCSQQVTMNTPIPVAHVGERRYAVDGSPADCVRLALKELVPDCKLVLSGINHGGNMGHDILLSGTVGAAREGAVLGVRAIALSQYFHGRAAVDWAEAATRVLQALAAIEAQGDESTLLWNVNLPNVDLPGTETAISFCRPCVEPLPIAYTRSNGAYAYDGARYHDRTRVPGTDVAACFGGSIAISRLAVGPTAP